MSAKSSSSESKCMSQRNCKKPISDNVKECIAERRAKQELIQRLPPRRPAGTTGNRHNTPVFNAQNAGESTGDGVYPQAEGREKGKREKSMGRDRGYVRGWVRKQMTEGRMSSPQASRIFVYPQQNSAQSQ